MLLFGGASLPWPCADFGNAAALAPRRPLGGGHLRVLVVPDLGTGLGTWDLVLRKLAHGAEFAVLGALLARAFRDELPALVAGIGYAVTDELHQHFVPGRVGAPLDVLIDSAGVGLGVVLWRRFGR